MSVWRALEERKMWLGWAGLTFGLTVFAVRSFQGDARAALLPGRTTHGHHQIELACESCHSEPYSDAAAIQTACESCHAEALHDAHDSHPRSKFLDPRNADRVAELDARYCVSCHLEHRPEATGSMGLTLPPDYCVKCHREIGEERPTHVGLPFSTCAQGGCHNFHDNRGLYEDYLLEHAGEPELLATPRVPARAEAATAEPRSGAGPGSHPGPGHSAAGVGCAECHGADREAQAGGSTDVPLERCEGCHAAPAAGFRAGLHGMRLAVGLTPMRPSMARLPMHTEAGDEALGCTSCHGAEAFDTRRAAYEACVRCHDDAHTAAYEGSPHFASFERELSGEGEPGSGVSCATCHMPRSERGGRVVVQHDQSDDLRPNEKMVRAVCTHCHGLAFTLDALADAALVSRNFTGRPARHRRSIEMAVRRVEDPSTD